MKINKEVLRFLVAGSLVTATDFGIYFLLGKVVNLSIAKGISFTCAGIVGYLLNKYWTFKQDKSSSAEIGRYWIVNFIALGLNILINQTMLNLWPNQVVPALIVATIATSTFTYIGFKWWVFKPEGKKTTKISQIKGRDIPMSKLRVLAIALLSVVSTAACAQTGGVVTESTKAVSSISGTAEQLTLAQAQIDKIKISIDDLSRAVNMQAAYAVYSKDVASIQVARQKAKAQRDAMQANSRSYITKWQMELETIQDKDVKSALESRKEKVAANFDKIRASLDELTEAYQPFLTNIIEIRKALALDLNASGIQSLESAMNKAKDQADDVKQKIADVREELTDIAGSMAPTTEVK